MTLDLLLRNSRNKKGWSLSHAARQLGCTKSHLHAMESGTSDNPCLSTLKSFVIVYGLKPNALLAVTKEMNNV